MQPIYYPDHDERYAHVPKRERWKYPDEVRIGPFRHRRTKLLKEITGEDIRKNGGVSVYLLAKDVPYTDGCCRC